MVEKLQFEELTALDVEQLGILLEVEGSMFDQAVAGLDASRYTPEAIIVINAKNKSDFDVILKSLNAYRDRLLDEYRDYRPSEMHKIVNAKVHAKGLQVVLIVSKDAAQAVAALKTIQK
ncbi:MAG: DUF4358 domain-containing protein [Clostridiales bacterium]|nr:DUF4358 domain-containing protein [Clostridiales bacterium]